MSFTGAGPGKNGYAHATATVRYVFTLCAGEVTMVYGYLKDSVRADPAYWYQGRSVTVPGHVTTPSPGTIRFSGSVYRGGTMVGSFGDQWAGPSLSGGCFGGQTKSFGPISRFVGEKASEREKQSFLDSLHLSVDSNGPLQNRAFEGEPLRAEQQAERERRQAQERAEAEARRKEKERAEAEARRKEQERAEAEARRREQDEQRRRAMATGAPAVGSNAETALTPEEARRRQYIASEYARQQRAYEEKAELKRRREAKAEAARQKTRQEYERQMQRYREQQERDRRRNEQIRQALDAAAPVLQAGMESVGQFVEDANALVDGPTSSSLVGW